MFLVFGIYEVFNLRHCELAHTKQSSTRGYLISEAATNLCARKRQPTIVEPKQAIEIYKVTLRGFRSKVTLELSGRPDAAIEHKIKLDRLADCVICVWVFNIVFTDDGAKFCTRIVIDL